MNACTHTNSPTVWPVWGEDHSSSVLNNTHDGVPQEASGERVHTCGGLILMYSNRNDKHINIHAKKHQTMLI